MQRCGKKEWWLRFRPKSNKKEMKLVALGHHINWCWERKGEMPKREERKRKWSIKMKYELDFGGEADRSKCEHDRWWPCEESACNLKPSSNLSSTTYFLSSICFSKAWWFFLILELLLDALKQSPRICKDTGRSRVWFLWMILLKNLLGLSKRARGD